MELVGQLRNQVTIHMRRARETMEEKDRGFARVSCFAVEDFETVDLDRLIRYDGA